LLKHTPDLPEGSAKPFVAAGVTACGEPFAGPLLGQCCGKVPLSCVRSLKYLTLLEERWAFIIKSGILENPTLTQRGKQGGFCEDSVLENGWKLVLCGLLLAVAAFVSKH